METIIQQSLRHKVVSSISVFSVSLRKWKTSGTDLLDTLTKYNFLFSEVPSTHSASISENANVVFFCLFSPIYIFKIKRRWYFVHDEKKKKKTNWRYLFGEKKSQQASGVACLGGRLGSNEEQRQSTSLIPAMLAQSKEFCEICLGGDSFGREKTHLLV